MLRRGRTRDIGFSFTEFDGTNAAELAEFAGERFLGSYGRVATVLNGRGEKYTLTPGWRLYRFDSDDGGSGDLIICSPGAWFWAEEEVA